MNNFLLILNRVFLGINVGLLVINLAAGDFLGASVALLCGILNYQVIRQMS